MKTMKLWAMAAAICITGLFGCDNNANTKVENKATQETEPQQTEVALDEQTCMTAIEDYLVNTIGSNYAAAEICIPYSFVVNTDETNADDILVWGDFWVLNYNLSGDTLKTVSGGNHPGLMHVKKNNNGYEVTSFDAVVDGAGNIESAKEIFGEHFDAYQAISSDDAKRNEDILRITADYVKKHGIKATMAQDYGWPAKNLPL